MQRPNYTFKSYMVVIVFLLLNFSNIKATPIGTISANNTSICEGAIIDLTFTATVGVGNYNIVVNGTTYSGVSSGAVFSTMTEGVDFAGTTTFTLDTIYDLGVMGVDTNAMPASFVSVTVNSLPMVDPVTGSSSVCIGSSITLKGNGTGGTAPYTYNWSIGSGGLTAPTSMVDSITVTGASAGLENVSYSVMDANGCASSASSSKLVAVTAVPVANPITGVDSLCLGGATTLTANPSGGGSYTIEWISTNTNTTGSSTNNTIVLTGAAVGTTNWTYRATASGCTSPPSSNFTTTVNPLPMAGSILGNNAVCLGNSTTLTGNPLGGTAPYTYSWNLSNGNVSGTSTTNTITLTGVTANNSTDVFFSLTDAKGCTSSGLSLPYTVTVNPLPLVGNATGATAICSGTNTTITANPSGGTPSYSYNWILNGNVSGSSATNTINVTGGSAGNGTVQYTVTDANGCAAADTSMPHGITVQPLPIAGNITGSSDVCLGDSITLSTSATNGTMPYSYAWTFDNNLVGSSTTENIVLEGITVGMANVTQITTDANGCVSSTSAPFVVTINALPTPSIISIDSSGLMPNDAIICVGDSISLDAGNYIAYSWNDMNLTTTQLLTVSPSINETYTVIVTDTNNCMATTNIMVVVNPIPSIDTVNIPTNTKSGEDFQIELSPNVTDVTYTWSAIQDNVEGARTGQEISDIITENLTLSNPRTGGFVNYSVGIEAEGCIGSITDFSITVLNLGMEEILSIPNTFSPNGDGMNEIWNIRLLDGSGNIDDYTVMIFNRAGAIIHEGLISEGWTGDNAPDGGYLYIVQGPNNEMVKGTVTLIR